MDSTVSILFWKHNFRFVLRFVLSAILLMDLLNDYSSSDNDEGKESNKATVTEDRPVISTRKSKTKQTKVLKLASILPPDVLQRLEQNDDQSSSDEEDVRSARNQTKSSTGASALLTSLHSIKPKGASPFPVSAFSHNSNSVSQLPQTSTPDQKPCSRGGDKSDSVVSTVSMNAEKAGSSRRNVVSAAPRVLAAPTTSYPNPNPSVPQPLPPTSSSSQDPPPSLPTTNSRKSRQNLERELRNGNVGAITTPHSHASTVIGDTTAVRVVDYASAQTIRSVPEGVYDPVTGKLSAAGKRGAGKNQVHVLVHQAAALERQRAEQMNSTSQRRRADAKRKYGW